MLPRINTNTRHRTQCLQSARREYGNEVHQTVLTDLVFLQCLLEPIRSLVDLLSVPRHAAQPQVAVYVARVLLQDALVHPFSPLKLTDT